MVRYKLHYWPCFMKMKKINYSLQANFWTDPLKIFLLLFVWIYQIRLFHLKKKRQNQYKAYTYKRNTKSTIKLPPVLGAGGKHPCANPKVYFHSHIVSSFKFTLFCKSEHFRKKICNEDFSWSNIMNPVIL